MATPATGRKICADQPTSSKFKLQPLDAICITILMIT